MNVTHWTADMDRPALPSLLALVAGGAVAAVLLTSAGQSLTMVALGTAVLVLLFVAAAVHFEWLILALLATRATLDVTDPGGDSLAKPSSLVAIVMIVMSTMWLVLNRAQTPARRWSALSIGLAGYIAIATLSILQVDNPAPVVADVLALVGGLLMFLVVERLLTLGMSLRRLVAALAGAAIGPLTVPLVGPLVGLQTTHDKEGITALRSTFVLSNNFAQFLVAVILVTIPMAMRLSGRLRLLAWTVVAAASIELVFTNTRGTWIGVIVGVIVLGLIENRRLVVGLLLLVTVAVLAFPGVRERITDLSDDPSERRSEDSLDWRLDHWSTIIPWAEDSRLTGVGFGMVRQIDEDRKSPHNDYVRAYVETGYVGLAAYVTFMIGFLSTAWRARRRVSEGWTGGLTAGVFAFAVAFAVVSLAENLVASITFMWYAAALAAIASWIVHNAGDQQEPIAASTDVTLERT